MPMAYIQSGRQKQVKHKTHKRTGGKVHGEIKQTRITLHNASNCFLLSGNFTCNFLNDLANAQTNEKTNKKREVSSLSFKLLGENHCIVIIIEVVFIVLTAVLVGPTLAFDEKDRSVDSTA